MGLRVMAVLCAAPLVFAHDSLERYVQHAAILSVTSNHIDVTLEICFNAHDSLEERRIMDANRDAVLSDDEKKAYLTQVLAAVEKRVALRVDGKDLRLVPLYDPELDFYDSSGLEEHPHLLRIFLFAQTPAMLSNGSDIQLEDRLWEAKPAMLHARVKDSDGIELTARQSGTALRLDDKREKRLLQWTCTAFRKAPAESHRRARGEGS